MTTDQIDRIVGAIGANTECLSAILEKLKDSQNNQRYGTAARLLGAAMAILCGMGSFYMLLEGTTDIHLGFAILGIVLSTQLLLTVLKK